MIKELLLFGMGFLLASFIRQMKTISIVKEKEIELSIATAEAEEMQKEFNEKGGSKELEKKQIKNLIKLERHIAYREILNKFNFLIW